MKVYLVGGAVRDRLLHYPVKERDWVVIGANPNDLLQQGYIPVGKDFPVFLHPETREEYALARKEHKSAPGYHGFNCDFNVNVTLVEDLSRRDLTINAMAMDADGTLIDPYQGRLDLNNKQLRHVSLAFIEDPVRLLRVARFAARYHYLGFTIALETRYLMYQMVKNNEIAHLVAERIWKEWQRSLTEKNPELFILTLRSCGALAVILPELDALFGVPSSNGTDSGIEALTALKHMAQQSTDPLFRFAAITFNLGKALTNIMFWPQHLGYEKASTKPINTLCQRLKVPTEYRQFSLLVARFHTVIANVLILSAKEILSLFEQTDAFRRPAWFNKLLEACDIFQKQRNNVLGAKDQRTQWSYLLDQCLAISVAEIISQGYQQAAISHQLNLRRLKCIKWVLNVWKNNEK